MLDSNDKGAIAEAEIAIAAIRQHVPVFKPLSEHGRTDLVLESDNSSGGFSANGAG